MPSGWHLVKQLASVLGFGVIEDASVAHFHVSYPRFATVSAPSPFWHFICN
jgi:hypothetical protein